MKRGRPTTAPKPKTVKLMLTQEDHNRLQHIVDVGNVTAQDIIRACIKRALPDIEASVSRQVAGHG